jgi:ADP-dependent NAD(P)H-hydrate dehydratase
MTGAAIIAGQSALRVGAGLVTLALPRSMQAAAVVACPVAMTLGLAWRAPTASLFKQINAPRFAKSMLAMGPGLGRAPNTDELVEQLYREWPQPMVIDADALNAAADWEHNQWRTTVARILTPHPGEWERICGVSSRDVDGQRQAALEFAQSTNCIVVLKGHHTWITDGLTTHENQTGNASLAVGGSGDCLTGIIVGLCCQGLAPMDAAVLGVYLHGFAADLAHDALGTPSTLATDLLAYLPAAMKSTL